MAELACSGIVLNKRMPIQFELREGIVELLGHTAAEDKFLGRKVCNY
jgi:hypothetical protein